MHKHYNQFWVIGQGQGEWNYSSVAEAAAAMPENFNFVNPPVRGKSYKPQIGSSDPNAVNRQLQHSRIH